MLSQSPKLQASSQMNTDLEPSPYQDEHPQLLRSAPPTHPLFETSPFQEWLAGNPTPSSEEVHQIRSLVSPHQTEIRAIDAKIQDLQLQIARLEQQKEPLTEFVVKHERLIHPVHRLPPEILQEIFIRTLAPPTHWMPVSVSMRPGDCPTILTGISRRWRDVAINTPQLWSTLHIALIPADFPDARGLTRARASGLALWLSRSGSLPLSFTIVQMGRSTGSLRDEMYNPLDDIFPLLRAESHRWGRVHIALALETMTPFLSLDAADIPMLTSVTFRISFPDYVDDPRPKPFKPLMSSVMVQTANLKELSVSGLRSTLDITFLTYPIPWENLTVLIVSGGTTLVDNHLLLRVLDRTKSLQHLRVEIGDFAGLRRVAESNAPLAFESVITLPYLKKLGVHEFVPFNNPPLGVAIRCPLLEELEYYEHIPNDPRHPTTRIGESLFALLSHSGGCIQSLTVCPTIYSATELVHHLRNCPQLRALVFADSLFQYIPGDYGWPGGIDKDFLQAFVTPDPLRGGQVLCPRLSVLFCNRSVVFTPQEFIEFLRAKQGGELELGVVQLERVMVRFDASTEPEGFYDEAASLVRGGRDGIALEFIPENLDFLFDDDRWLLRTRQNTVISVNDGSWMGHTHPMWNSMPLALTS